MKKTHLRDEAGRYTYLSFQKRVMKIIHRWIDQASWFLKRLYWTGLIMGFAYVSILSLGAEIYSIGYIHPVQAQTSLKTAYSASDGVLNSLGKMGIEIKLASEEFDVPVELILGIANSESSLGKNFVHPYDINCNNWWGIKPPSGVREDGSYLRCLVDEKAGARTAASLIKRLYLDQGLDTPEEIVKKWVGSKHTQYHDTWVKNVKVYYK